MADEISISVAKVVANPTASSWSQAYNAGKLFAVLSLEKKSPEEKREDYLSTQGKEIIEGLEQEFFTLETKDLPSIKTAFEATTKKIPEDLSISFVVASIVKNVIYIFSQGPCRVNIKRADELGTLLEEDEEGKISAISGMIKNEDLLILQTRGFKDLVSSKILISSLDHQSASDIAETIAPIIHGEEGQGGASAIIFELKFAEEEPLILEKITDGTSLSSQKRFSINLKNFLASIRSRINISSFRKIPHTRRLFLTITIVVALVLISTIYLSIKSRNDAKVRALFESVYPNASKKYDEGQSLLSLNKNLARDSFKEAYNTLNENKSKFPKDSKEEKQILSLFDKTSKALLQASGIESAEAKEVNESSSPLLSSELKNPSSSYFVKSDEKIYFLKKDGVVSEDLNGENQEILIKISELPKNIGGFGVYFGNFYILDKDSGQIYKFVESEEEYSKTNYFPKDSSPNLSKAQSIAIDGSIWILSSDGSISKYTKGKSDNLNISGLDKPLSNPSRIFTDADSDNVYILDNGNLRIVVSDKNGGYKSQYQTNLLKNAKDFEVKEAGKKIYILSGNKIYQIDLK